MNIIIGDYAIHTTLMHDIELMVGNFYCLVAQCCDEATVTTDFERTHTPHIHQFNVTEPIAIINGTNY